VASFVSWKTHLAATPSASSLHNIIMQVADSFVFLEE
jgi:hypothetical protein